MENAGQVEDDIRLLRLMLEDMWSAESVYQPGNYWKQYENKFVNYLEKNGLKDFRRRSDKYKGQIFASFGASDPLVASVSPRQLHQLKFLKNTKKVRYRIPGTPTLLTPFQVVVDYLARRLVKDPVGTENMRRLQYEFVKGVGEKWGAAPLGRFSGTRIGNPEDWFEVDGNIYSINYLYYYLRYAYTSRFFNWDSAKIFIELGSGGGKQVEIIHKLHPSITICLFDIPPTLYVCHQYLSRAFPGQVITYPESRAITVSDELESGKIYIFGSCHFSIIEGKKVD